MATAAIIREGEPTGNYSAPHGVTFRPADKKGLLVCLYHDFSTGSTFEGYYDFYPDLWHSTLEQWIIGEDHMFGKKGTLPVFITPLS